MTTAGQLHACGRSMNKTSIIHALVKLCVTTRIFQEVSINSLLEVKGCPKTSRRVWNRTFSRANFDSKVQPSQYFCLFDDLFWGSRILSFLKPNLPKPKRQRKIRRRFCPGLSSTFMRPVSSRLAQFFLHKLVHVVFVQRHCRPRITQLIDDNVMKPTTML